MTIEARLLHNLVRTYRRALRESGCSGWVAMREPNPAREHRTSLSVESSRRQDAVEAAPVPARGRSGEKVRVSS